MYITSKARELNELGLKAVIIQSILATIIAIPLMLILFNFIERNECREWQNLQGIEWQSWQIEQCNHHNIPIHQE